jgi:hypothetical protein
LTISDALQKLLALQPGNAKDYALLPEALHLSDVFQPDRWIKLLGQRAACWRMDFGGQILPTLLRLCNATLIVGEGYGSLLSLK